MNGWNKQTKVNHGKLGPIEQCIMEKGRNGEGLI
jgi:hypothetical protein